MTTALLVIDVQESFRQADGWPAISAPDIAERADRLVEHARSRGDHVIWVLHSEPGTSGAFDPEKGFVRLLPPLQPIDGEPTLIKTSHNAFTTTDLGRRLTSLAVTDVVISGIRTEQCCETTARVASDLGYGVTFVLDGTATHPLPLWREDESLSTVEVQRRTASALQGRFARVVTMDEHLAS